ncbi:MAG TPA: hypothetical protein PLB81_07460, partial [Deltaproteobacteria bacterium]|nr:hypothetical protein [Deltaproteobacteria bacterium]
FKNAQDEANKLRAIKEITTEQQTAIKNLEAARAQAEAAELADARKTMMEDFNNAQETYNFELELLEKRRDRYAYLMKDQAAADIWYAKKKKALDNELAKSSDDYIAGVKAGYSELEEDLYTWGRAGADALKTFNDASKTLVSDSLFSFMKGDMNSFSAYWDSFCDSMLRSFTDAVAQMVVQWAIGQAGMAASSAGSGIGGGIGGFIATLFTSAHGNVFMNGSPMAFRAGGLITRPTIFPMANGGIGMAGEAGTEAIMPLKRLGNGNLGVKSSGGGVTVNVINNGSQSQASVQQTRTANGGLQLDVLIDDIVAGKIAKGRTRNALMQQAAGFRPNIIRR